MAFNNVRESSGAQKVHSVHVHLGEKRSRHCDDGRDNDLSGLVELANVAHMHIPCDVMSNERPPVSFGDEHVSGIEPVMSDVIVCHFHGSSPLSLEEDALVSALGVALPEYSVIGEEAGCIADDEGVLMVTGSIQAH